MGGTFVLKVMIQQNCSHFIKHVITKVEETGIKIRGILSDMGPKNQALWKDLGIKVGRKSNTFSISHPIRPNDVFYVMADVPHLLKNLKSMFVTHSNIVISDEIVLKYNLGSNIIKSDYVRQCITIQEKLELKLTPNLNLSKLQPTNNFDKMNVGFACDVCLVLKFLQPLKL